jgi:hypothetical protein
MEEWFIPTRVSISNTLIPRRNEWIIKIRPALQKAELKMLVAACKNKLSRREIIELRAGRSKPHRKTKELLVSILKKARILIEVSRPN